MKKLWLLQNGIHSVKALTAEIESLLSEKNAGYTECQEKERRVNDLLTIRRNTDLVLHGAPSFSSLSVPFSCAVIDVLKLFDG